MRLDEKRKVVEVLLCSTDWWALPVECMRGDFEVGAIEAAAALVSDAATASTHTEYEHDACEAAYRLIESSPALRREWFGAR